jgi:hypothetical protein
VLVVGSLLIVPCAGALAQESLPDSSAEPLTGTISVSSNPSDARIILDGAQTGLTTPAIITDVPVGRHTIELSVPEYLFSRQHIEVLPDTTVTLSFELISGVDTAVVIGQLRLGLLVMPRPPIATPYIVDGRPVSGLELTINEGKHRVEWEGGSRYSSLDTVVEVFAGRATTFDFRPKRREGTLTLQPYPTDAEVYIDGKAVGFGAVSCTLATGSYTIQARRDGYYPAEKSIELRPDREAYVAVELPRIQDEDDDGFLDSVDRCPRVYGLYDGCPTAPRREVLKLNARRLIDNMQSDPFTISVATLGYLQRTPLNPTFRRFMDRFTEGKGYLNNRNGFTAASSYSLSYRGFIVSADLGQWNFPVEYRGVDTLTVGRIDGQRYVLVHDTLNARLEPRIVLPSTALSAGLHFSMHRFTIAYTVGYQWEDILIFDITREGDTTGTAVEFDNDGLLNRLSLEADLNTDRPLSPSGFCTLSFCVGRNQPTGWFAVHFGIQLKFRPYLRTRDDTPTPTEERS